MSAKPEKSVYDDGGSWLRGEFLGEGCFGTVHLAHFPINPNSLSPRFQGFPSLVAVKSDVVDTSNSWLEEEKAIYELLGQSPFVIRYYGDDVTVDAENGKSLLNLFIEYASGGDLNDLIEKSEGLGLLESQAKEFTRSILRGIEHIHEAGVIHCDLKPENVLLVGEGGLVAKIGDFGSAKKVKDKLVENKIQGTRMYLAPECTPNGIQGQPSDIWALGCVVYSMLTGRLEWKGEPIIDGNNNFSKEAEDFIRKCLTRSHVDRPTATELLSHSFVNCDHRIR